MGVEYDEISISTMREIDVCRKNLKRLKKTLEEMEKRYKMKTPEFMEKFRWGDMKDRKDYLVWHDCYQGLQNWEERMRELAEILQRHSSPGKIG